MIELIKQDFIDFYNSHKNIYNLSFHIFCGFMYMSLLFSLSKKYKNSLLIMYVLLMFFLFQNLFLIFIIFIILFTLLFIINKYKLSFTNSFLLFFSFYFLPELSHILTNEPTVLNLNNITPLSIFTNVFCLLPFSLMSLFNSK